MITYRSVKGDELEHHEVDENFKYLDEKSSNYEVGHVYRGSVIRIYNGHLYLLSSSVTFPFTATNFATELAAGNWLLIGSSSSYKGELNLTAPVLTNGVGVVGDYYKVVEAGDYDFGAGDIAFKVGDFVFYDGSVYGPYVDNNQLFSTNYLKKTFDKIQTHVGTGTDVVIPLNTTGYRNIYLQGAMTSVAGFSFNDIIAAPGTSEFPHDGKEYVLWNKSGHDITLKNEIIANDVSFSFKEGTDLVVPDNECVVFMNDTNVLFERDRSFNLSVLITDTSVTGTYEIDWSKKIFRLTLTGNTTFTEIKLPAEGYGKTITIQVSGNYTLTYPAGWTAYITGSYSGTAIINTIVVQNFGSGLYKVLITQPD